jgi:hypothetical protein
MDDRELLERFAPELHYDSQGSFLADSARTMTDYVAPDGRSSNSLKDADGQTLAMAKPEGQQPRLDIEFLGGRRYADKGKVTDTDYLDAAGNDYVLAARELHANPDYANRCYGHVARQEDRAFLQYWFFYYWNNKAFLGFGLHEGDWEMVQIGLAANGRPKTMTFAQHDHAERCRWRDVEKVGRRPVVYVARGSQASYPRPGRHRAPIVPDNADGQGAEISPLVEVLGDRSPSWNSWPGRWGSSRARNIAESDSPRGPKLHDQWSAPGDFESDAVERDDLRGLVMGQPELQAAPAPRISAHRTHDHAIVEYRFPRPSRGEAPATQIVVSVDSPEDELPPATYSFPVEALQGEIEHPLRLASRRYVVRASGFTREAVGSDTVEVPLREPREKVDQPRR